MTFEIVLILLLILLNGVLAMSEIALVSAKKVRLRQRAEGGDKGARVALELAEEPGRFLSTVQIGITLVGILAGAFGGATVAEKLAARIEGVALLAPYSEAIGVGLVVLVITYLSLILGELVPKQLGLNAPEEIASRLARPLRLLSRVSAPVVHLLDASTRLLVRLLGARPSEDPPITEEEFKHLLDLGRAAGVFDPQEQAIVERVLRLGDMRVGELVTHRSQMVYLDVEDPPGLNQARMLESGHFYYPVCQGGPDRVLGLVSVRDLWARSVTGEPTDLRSALFEPLYLPESLPAFKVLESFRTQSHHVALVLDEYGGIEGLVTLNDVLQALVGEIPAPDEAGLMVVAREDGSWLLDGMLPVGELEGLLRLSAAEAGDLEEYQSLGGFVMGRIGRVPEEGDRFDWREWRFEVLDMDGLRVDKVLLAPLPAEATAREV
jgi:putative hemolysin